MRSAGSMNCRASSACLDILSARAIPSGEGAVLVDTLGLDDEMVGQVVSRGWGLAGVRDGDRILATKIPKSGYLAAYLREADPERKRQIYCHCPRVRDAPQRGAAIPVTYCYCGAGYYRGIWETILGKSVRVEVLKSVLQGDDLCTIAIYLSTQA